MQMNSFESIQSSLRRIWCLSSHPITYPPTCRIVMYHASRRRVTGVVIDVTSITDAWELLQWLNLISRVSCHALLLWLHIFRMSHLMMATLFSTNHVFYLVLYSYSNKMTTRSDGSSTLVMFRTPVTLSPFKYFHMAAFDCITECNTIPLAAIFPSPL